MTKPWMLRRHPLTRAFIALGHDQYNAADAIRFAKAQWPDDLKTIELIEKGAVTPLTTAGLASTAVSDVVSILGPLSAFGEVFPRALSLSSEKNTSILVPAITASAASITFIAQGTPIPVKQFVTSGVTLDPKKMAIAIALTREILQHSNAEALTTAALRESCSLAVDTLFLDAVAADSTRPAGLRNGVGAITATALGANITQADAMAKDLAALAAAVAPVAGSLQNICYVASPGEAVKIAMRSLISPFPVFASSGLAAGVVLCLATNALAIAADPSPRFSTSDEATLHFEDTTPLPLASVGTPNTIASPVRSLWQTDCTAIRVILDCNWILRASGAVAWTQAVTW